MNGQKSILDGPIRVVMWVACVFTVLMMAHITLDVSLRVLFNSPLVGTFEVAANYYMVAVMYLPLAYVSRTDGQIIVELFTRKLGERTLLRWDAVANVLTVLYLLAFTVYTAKTAVEQTIVGEIKETGDEYIDIWPARWLLPVAFGLMGLYLLVRMRQDLRRAGQTNVPISA